MQHQWLLNNKQMNCRIGIYHYEAHSILFLLLYIVKDALSCRVSLAVSCFRFPAVYSGPVSSLHFPLTCSFPVCALVGVVLPLQQRHTCASSTDVQPLHIPGLLLPSLPDCLVSICDSPAFIHYANLVFLTFLWCLCLMGFACSMCR